MEEALLTEVAAWAGSRYARDDGRPAIVRWGAQPGSIYLAAQQLRWCGAALWAMARKIRRVKQYRHLHLLQQTLHGKLSLTNCAAA